MFALSEEGHWPEHQNGFQSDGRVGTLASWPPPFSFPQVPVSAPLPGLTVTGSTRGCDMHHRHKSQKSNYLGFRPIPQWEPQLAGSPLPKISPVVGILALGELPIPSSRCSGGRMTSSWPWHLEHGYDRKKSFAKAAQSWSGICDV